MSTESKPTLNHWTNKKFLSALIIWYLVEASLLLFWIDINAKLWILTDLLHLAWIMVGVLIIIWSLYKSIRPQISFFKIGLNLFVVWMALIIMSHTRLHGETLRFKIHKKEYEKTVLDWQTKLKMGQIDPSTIKGIQEGNCYIDVGPPLRIAFVWPGGIIDNWIGVVYDPSGFVMKCREFERSGSNWDDPSLRKGRELFGGDMFYCRQLEEGWYLCSFT